MGRCPRQWERRGEGFVGQIILRLTSYSQTTNGLRDVEHQILNKCCLKTGWPGRAKVWAQHIFMAATRKHSSRMRRACLLAVSCSMPCISRGSAQPSPPPMQTSWRQTLLQADLLDADNPLDADPSWRQTPRRQTPGRNGSRIPRRRGRQPSRREAPAYKFPRFSEKLHEIKKILVRRGAAPGVPPGSATAWMQTSRIHNPPSGCRSP